VDINKAYLHQYSKGGNDYLQLSLESAERAIEVILPDHVDRSRALNARANALGARYLDKVYDDDIDQAIDEMESALNPTLYSLDDQDKSLFLRDYAIHLGYRYRSDRAMSGPDLDRAIEAAQQAVGRMSLRNPDRGNALYTLSVWLGERAKHTTRKEDIYQAIDVGREALKSTPPTGADLAFVLCQLAAELRLRYEFEASKDDLQEALDIGRQAIYAIPQDHNFYPRCLDLYEAIREHAESENLQHGDCRVGYIRI
jgi:hypothetical protein